MERTLHSEPDLRISIVGLERGIRPVGLTCPVTRINGISEEFVEDVTVEGSIRRIGERLYLDAEVTGTSRLQCDRSLEMYDEQIVRQLNLVYEVDTELALSQKGEDVSDADIRGLFQDAQWIDISEDVRQELLLGLPMKRVAPKFRQQSIEEIFPDLQHEDEIIDDRWEALRRLRENKSLRSFYSHGTSQAPSIQIPKR